jgi:hypothetical protein
MQIQEYLISAVHNIEVLLRYGSYPKESPSVMMEQIKGAMTGDIKPFPDFKEWIDSKMGQMMLLGFFTLRYHSSEFRFSAIFKLGF